MRRFSQRNSLVTLSDINITPMLDLAFVLLIIFVIISPSLKSIEHVKRTLERAVAQEAIALESGLILLAITVSGSPFLGLLGTVWGVMISFTDVAAQGSANLTALAPGVAGALVTTVAGLLVAIPSMFGYNWLVHTLRVMTVELDNFAQELMSKMETEYLQDEEAD